MNTPAIHRILTIDDNPAIHEDFRKLFAASTAGSDAFRHLESEVFGIAASVGKAQVFDLDAAFQGQEGLEKVEAALAARRPYSLVFVDVRMPPGWDGVETIERLWKADTNLQVVICTAYSDYSWDDMQKRLGKSDSLLVLKKPFDTVEVLQIAHAMTRKWELTREARASIDDLDRKVAERTEALKCEMAERTRVEDSLRQSQKMEAVGQLAAGIAHDFNNLLTVIQGHAGLLLAGLTGDAGDTESLKQVAAAATRAGTLTSQLLAFSRKGPVCAKPLDLNPVLANASKLLHRVIGEHIELRLDLSDQPTPLTADDASLVQVIMNLAINARDAMPDGGSLTLGTSMETLDVETARRHSHARPGSFVCLTVTDDGCGMDAATQGKIFDPFFTTKDAGKGTGLGLATVWGIVQRHDGWIEVISQPGQGTTFKVLLPHQDGHAKLGGNTELIFRAPSKKGPLPLTILVVEDDSAIRAFLKTVLTMNSYHVIEATDGVDALEVWSKHAGRVDLLLTDMVMPNGLSGRGLAEKLQNECAWLKVIYSSGYGADVIGVEFLEAPGVAFLPKPYNADDLLRAVSSVTSQTTHPPTA